MTFISQKPQQNVMERILCEDEIDISQTTVSATTAVLCDDDHNNNNNNISIHTKDGTWSETALAWWKRVQQQREERTKAPKHPAAAARAFCHDTGLAFLPRQKRQRRRQTPLYPHEHQLHQQHTNKYRRVSSSIAKPHLQQVLPFVELTGPVAKTSTLLSLAAQFVVQTRSSRFDLPLLSTNTTTATTMTAKVDATQGLLPQVFILDSHWQVSAWDTYKLVRAKLLCDYDALATTLTESNQSSMEHATTSTATSTGSIETNDAEKLAADVEDCVSRIHIATVDEDNSVGWLPILETLSAHLAEASLRHPTLLLWDGLGDCLQNDDHDEASRTEIQRSLLRLLQQYDVMMVYTGTTPLSRKRSDWDDRVTHRVRLDRTMDPTLTSQPFVARTMITSGAEEILVPFSISAVGVRT